MDARLAQSLGSVMYAMCTGHAPFRAESSYSVLRLITDKEPRPIREINPDVPEWLCSFINKLMSKLASDRFASAEEIAELLERCLAHVQKPTTNELPSQLAVPQKLSLLIVNAISSTYMKMKASKLIIRLLVTTIIFLIFVVIQSERKSRAMRELFKRELYYQEKKRDRNEAGQGSENSAKSVPAESDSTSLQQGSFQGPLTPRIGS